MKNIILASSSKRRIEMMQNKGYEPVIMPADVDESLSFIISPEASVMYLALKKAVFIENKIKNSDDYMDFKSQGCIILAADTVVVYSGHIIGKPSDKDEAFKILSALRNSCHHVLTGVCIIDTAKNTRRCLCDDTAVYFNNYSDEELMAYVNTPEPYDKAGGYAIQETFKKHVHHIEGDFDNVVGFPWYRIEPLLI